MFALTINPEYVNPKHVTMDCPRCFGVGRVPGILVDGVAVPCLLKVSTHWIICRVCRGKCDNPDFTGRLKKGARE